MVRALAVPIVAAALAGCARLTPELDQPPVFTAVASAEEYAPYRAAGTAVITGRIAFSRGPGVATSGAGARVVLDPATTYARRWYAEVGLVPGHFDAVPNDTSFGSARRTTETDSAGAFAFRGLPAGSYIVATLESWEIPDGRFGLRPQLGVTSHLITLGANQTMHVEFGTRSVGPDMK